MPTRETYEFQKQEKRFVAGGDQGTMDDQQEFVTILGMKIDELKKLPQSVQDEIEIYVTKVHRYILYYVQRIPDEEAKIRHYAWTTVGLAVLIPALTFFVPYIYFRISSEPISGTGYAAIIPAQITAVVAGVFALHKLITLWVFRRNSIHAFWKASCQLKTLLYSFEDEWKNRLPNGPNVEFLRALREGRVAAEKIIEQEEESFFESYAKTSVDLQALIKSASSDASEVTGKIADPMIKALAADEQKRAKLADDLTAARQAVVEARAKKGLVEERIVRNKHRLLSLSGDAATAKQAELTAAREELVKL